MKNFARNYPVLSYYLLVFTISWGGILLLIGGPGNIPGTVEQAERLFFPALLIMFAGPILSGILMNFLYDGKAGLLSLRSRLLHWRIPTRWYVIAFFAGPLLVMAVLFGLSLFNEAFLPGFLTAENKISSLLFGFGWGLLGGGLLEETGWTGFAVPHLRKKYSIIYTGLIVGILWGIWHFMIAFWCTDYMRGTDSPLVFTIGFLIFYLVALPAYRILLVWMYERTSSLPAVMLMHANLSASTIIFQPSETGIFIPVFNLVLGLVFWTIVIMIRNK